jgi:hypothetical protein
MAEKTNVNGNPTQENNENFDWRRGYTDLEEYCISNGFPLLRIIGICKKHSLVISQLGGRKLVATVTLTQTLNTALKESETSKKARSNAAKSRAQLKKMESRVFKEFVLNAANFEPNKGLAGLQEQIEKNRKAISEAEEARVAKEIAEQKAIESFYNDLKGGN